MRKQTWIDAKVYEKFRRLAFKKKMKITQLISQALEAFLKTL